MTGRLATCGIARWLAGLSWVVAAVGQAADQVAPAALPQLLLPPVALTAQDIAVVVNDADPASLEVAAFYAEARRIPPERVIHLSFPAGRATLTQDEFRQLKAELDAKVPPQVQAYALAWTQPYRVDCMSITAAVAFGFDPRHCADGCRPTRSSPYYDSDSVAPFSDLGIRPAMLLAAGNVAEARTLIERGVRSDERWPRGRAYLMATSDAQRDVRSAGYPQVTRILGSAYPIDVIHSDTLRGRSDVMFYFTGLIQVPEIDSNRFLDGAIADHVTSAGGELLGGGQMSALEWLRAGATGSYGTALEPCNFRQKFPEVGIVMARYLTGETLIEAYWKSVQMPGQGVFVGEPLARPFGGQRAAPAGSAYEVRTHALRPGRYRMQSAPGGAGPYRDLGPMEVAAYGVRRIRLPAAPGLTYRLVRAVPGVNSGGLSPGSSSSTAWSDSRMPPQTRSSASTSADSTSRGSR
jgi:uncharacterized protein (TIGR03790 family)